MSDSKIPVGPTGVATSLGAAVAADVLSALHLPGGSTLKYVADRFVQRRRKEAAEILIAQISAGGLHGEIEFEERDIDPLIDIIFRFSKAVGDGAANDNLTFLAEVIAGLKSRRALAVDSFRRWAGILEDLTRDELLLIGKAYVTEADIFAMHEAGGEKIANDFWQKIQATMKEAGYSAGEISALCATVSRTGILVPVSAFGTTAYMPSPWLNELGSLTSIAAKYGSAKK